MDIDIRINKLIREVNAVVFFKRSKNTKSIKIVGWIRLPSLTVCIFGSIDSVPDLKNIELALREFLISESENIWSPSEDFEKEFKSKFKAISLTSQTFRSQSLVLSENMWKIGGDVMLLINSGATISETDAHKVINVLSEFATEPKLMLVQGKGYHAFVRSEACIEYEFCRIGTLMSHCNRFGFKSKRIDYLTIDPSRNCDYEF